MIISTIKFFSIFNNLFYQLSIRFYCFILYIMDVIIPFYTNYFIMISGANSVFHAQIIKYKRTTSIIRIHFSTREVGVATILNVLNAYKLEE